MKNTRFMTRVLAISVLLLISIPLAAATYLPTMPAGTGNFGTAIQASATFNDGYHWDDPSTPADDRDIPAHYLMPSTMPLYTAGDALDYHWVWVNKLGDYVVWDFTNPICCVRVYPSQDHGPYIGAEFDEYTVYASNNLAGPWNLATQKALYYDDINNVRTHDGVKDYYLGGTAYRYIKICSAIDDDFELDAVEEIACEPIPEFPTMALPVASILGLLFLFNYRKRKEE